MKSLRTKLILSYAVILLFLAIVAVISYTSINSYAAEVRALVQEDFVLLEHYYQLSYAITERLAQARGYLLHPENVSFYDEFRARTGEIGQLEQELLQNERAASITHLIEMSREWATGAEEGVFSAVSAGDLKTAFANAGPLALLGKEIIEGFETALEEERQYISEREEELAALRSTSISIIITASLAACASGLLLALLLSNAIATPVINVSKRLRLVADGDISGEALAVRSKDEVGQLVQAMNHVVGTLREMILVLENRADELVANSEQLSASAEENGAAVAEVAATANEFASTVGQMAHQSREMTESAEGISDMVIEGEKAIVDAVQNTNELSVALQDLERVIEGLGSRSNEIGQIVAVITDIAEQTNLLALNAAIEAARAGEHGRGFAVVAAEVRKLAEESSQAAEEIAELINSIQGETGTAVEAMVRDSERMKVTASVVESAGERFRGIIRHIHTITDQIAQINAEIEVIGTASQEIAATTEQQSASVEDAASAAQALADMSGGLRELVGQFRLR